MSEDRTQAPTRRRRQLARERGHVPRSPELTAAAVLLGVATALAARGRSLALSLVALLRDPLGAAAGPGPASWSRPEAVVGRLRELALAVGGDILIVILSGALAGLAAHQAQVRGLWAPGLLAPDPARLWLPARGEGPDVASRARRGAWSLTKSCLVALTAAWILRAEWPGLASLGMLDTPAIATAAGATACRLALILGLATLALGVADFAAAWFRFEALLRMSPEEAREDMRSAEGDPVLRARRRRLAQAMRRGDSEELAGASLVLTGRDGLTVVLAGGPPPRRVTVRGVATGARGERLRRDAHAVNLPERHAPDLAHRIARRRPPSLPLGPELREAIAEAWTTDR